MAGPHFWSSDLHGDEAAVQSQETMPTSQDNFNLVNSPRSLKRKASSDVGAFEDVRGAGTKRQRQNYDVATPPQTPCVQSWAAFSPSPSAMPKQAPVDTDPIVDVINRQFGVEILRRHEELRFINQELAKCQVALEQLRRCHLIPYPTTCPTPLQMLDIVDGKIPALQSESGGPTPQWAPPYGVVDGPYARHYAKWLIPDPKFDGHMPEWQVVPAAARLVEGRSTRNSQCEGMTIGKRTARGQVAQKVQASVVAPKTKGPCIVKRSDGVTVKLFCHLEKDGKNCNRDDFSSTQGFINHVRITHKKDFKSHDEAAFFCGVPVTGDESVPARNEEKTTGLQPAVQSNGAVHALTRADAETDVAYKNILQRINESIQLYKQGKLPGVTGIPGSSSRASAGVASKDLGKFTASPTTPFLSQLLEGRHFQGDLRSIVEDARDMEESDEDEGLHEHMPGDTTDTESVLEIPHGSRGGSAMRPASSADYAASATAPGTSSCKGRSPHLSQLSTASGLPPSGLAIVDEDASSVGDDNMMDIDRSPNTASSSRMPQLVFDAESGDDSDDQSSSGDASDTEVPKIAEVDLEDDDMQDSLAPHAGSTSNGTQKRDEARHVKIVPSVTAKTAARRQAAARHNARP